MNQRCRMSIGHHPGVAVRLLVALFGCLLFNACAISAGVSAGVTPAAAVTRITLETNCFGCANGGILVLRRDGVATLTQTGSARQGTQDKVSKGRLSVDDFDRLARLLVTEGFFELQDSYEDPELKDGPWATTSAMRDGKDKRVFRRDTAGPAALHRVEAAIDAVRARIVFDPEAR